MKFFKVHSIYNLLTNVYNLKTHLQGYGENLETKIKYMFSNKINVYPERLF